MEIDRTAADPPWVQLAAILRGQIERGELTGKIPSERSIQQETGLAPVTIRKAIHALRDEGWVVTVPGWGTFTHERES